MSQSRLCARIRLGEVGVLIGSDPLSHRLGVPSEATPSTNRTVETASGSWDDVCRARGFNPEITPPMSDHEPNDDSPPPGNGQKEIWKYGRTPLAC